MDMRDRNNRKIVVEFYAENICNKYKYVSKCINTCYKQEDLTELDSFIDECCSMCTIIFKSGIIQTGMSAGTKMFTIRPVMFNETGGTSVDIIVKIIEGSSCYKYRIDDDYVSNDRNCAIYKIYGKIKESMK